MKINVLSFFIFAIIVTSCRQGNDAKVIESQIVKKKAGVGLIETNASDCFVEAKIGNKIKKHENLDCAMQPACTIINAGSMSMSIFSIVLGDESITINMIGDLAVGTYSFTQKPQSSVIYGKKGDPKGFFAGQVFDESSFTLAINKYEDGIVSGTFSGILTTNKELTPTKEFLKITEGKFNVKTFKR